MNDQANERLRQLYVEHGAVVYRFLFAMLGRSDAAGELTQETFFRALKVIETFEARSSPATWLCGIARNVALNHLRSERRFSDAAPDELPERQASSPATDQPLLDGELREAIRRALLELDREKRVAFTLKVLEQKSYEEIAAITGSAIAKLKTDVHRARLQLRGALAGYWEKSR